MKTLLPHLVGDYLLQSHWEATEKTKKWVPAIAHGMTYALPFLALTRSPKALAVIAGTHIIIDHYRLARHVSWLKNQIGPIDTRPGWSDTVTGYSKDVPDWMATWLMIITDNTMHSLINEWAVRKL